jgi:hypothetical protein
MAGIRNIAAPLSLCCAICSVFKPHTFFLFCAHFITFAAQAAVPASSQYYRSACLWAVVAGLLAARTVSASALGHVLVNFVPPLVACVLSAKRMQLVKEVFAWSIAARVTGIKCAQFQQRTARKTFDDVRNESFFLVEHEISLQRATIEDGDKQGRADLKSNRFIVGCICLLFNAVTGGLFWKLQPAELCLISLHIILTLLSSLEPADTLPDGEIGANAAEVALNNNSRLDLVVLPGFSVLVCAVICVSDVDNLEKSFIVLTHAVAATAFQLRRPIVVGPAFFVLSLIKAVLEPR